MSAPVKTSYAKSGDVHIAYQVVGDGPMDLLFVMGWVSNLDYFWNEPHFARFLRRLASFSRLILFDKRGTGLSDRVAGLPTLEERTDDVRAVLEAVGSERTAILGISEGGAMCSLFSASHPGRVSAQIIIGGYARRLWSDDYPWGITGDERDRLLRHIESDWGDDLLVVNRAPSLADEPEFRDWWRDYLRMSASPGAAVALTRMNMEIDVREVLPAIRVPTLIIHRTEDQAVVVGNGRYLAKRIPGARYVELPGADHLPFSGDQEEVLREIEVFLTGQLQTPDLDRVLATLLTNGIVGGAATAVQVGDRAWAELTATFDKIITEQVERYRGQMRQRTLTGSIASFDGPARAIRCASAVVQAAAERGITARAGVHTGECAISDGEVSGVAVQIAERIYNQAGPGEVVVSNTVKDLVVGSGISFEPGETRLLTGLDSSWRLFRVSQEHAPRRASLVPGMDDIDAPSPTVLSPREREVAGLISRGASNRRIADELSISPATVERHVANILGKLGFHSRAKVAAWAVGHELGLLKVHDSIDTGL